MSLTPLSVTSMDTTIHVSCRKLAGLLIAIHILGSAHLLG